MHCNKQEVTWQVIRTPLDEVGWSDGRRSSSEGNKVKKQQNKKQADGQGIAQG